MSITAAVAFIATLLAALARGFDWTDEGFYLNWIASPWDFSVSVTQFGFVYHPLYLLVDGNIVLLRRLNLLITIGLAAILAEVVAKAIPSKDSVGRAWRLGWMALPVASLVLVFYRLPPTPSYNSLNLQALLIATIALMLLHKSGWRSRWAWTLLALGATLCFLAKLTSALALAVVVAAFFLAIRGWRELPWKGISVCAITLAGGLVLSATLIDGSPAAFVQRLAAASEEVRLLKAGQSVSLRNFYWRLTPPDRFESLPLLGLLAAGIALLAWRSVRGQEFSPRATAWISVILVAALVGSLLSLWGVVPLVQQSRRLEAGFLAFPVGVCLGAVLGLLSTRRLSGARDALCLAALLLALPFVYAFGTNMNLWLTTGNAAYFWFLPGILLLKERGVCILYLLVTQVLAVVAVGLYMHQPYRQSQPLFAPKVAVSVPAQGGVALGLTPDAADYARRLAQLAQQAELRPRTPLLDLTGHSPGAQYFLGARPVGSAWIIGGFPGSEAYARVLLARVPCEELAAAWVLTEPEGHRPVPETLLALHGIRVQDSLKAVGTLSAPIRARHVRYTQVLYRPDRQEEEAVAACRAARMRQPP